MADAFCCYYCNQRADSLETVVKHLMKLHRDNEIKYRQLLLDDSCGKFRFLTKTHPHVIPSALTKNGKSVSVSGERLVIKDDLKRKKLNTPNKNNHIEISDESTDSCSDAEESSMDTSSNQSLDFSSSIKELENLLPKVVQTLMQSGHLDTYIKFNELLSKDQMPLTNICYLLFLDLIEWFSVSDSNTSCMRYKYPETLKFWEVGMRLFHGKFIRFMSGTKNQGQVVEEMSEKGFFDPAISSINFAVPSQTILHKSISNKPPYLPGINLDLIEQLTNHYKEGPMILGIDGKKISRGKGKTMGDIDCWGFEDKPTLQDRINILKSDVEFVESVVQKVDKIELFGAISLENLLETARIDIVSDLKTLVALTGKRNEQLRETEVILCRSEEKFKSLGGDSWRTSRFFPVISLMRVKRNQVKNQLEESLKISDVIAEIGSVLNACYINFNKSNNAINMSDQQNYFEFNEQYVSSETNTRQIKQRTDEWFEIRSKAKVTGSTANSALGLDTLKRQKEHFENVVEGKQRGKIEPETKKKMEFGTKHEIDAISTVVSKVIPFFYPKLLYFEEGCEVIPTINDDHFMVVSPDGSFREGETQQPSMMYENKCKSPSSFSPHVYYNIPKYYVVQILSEMKAYNCQELLFTCWSEASLNAFHVTFSQELWAKCWQELVELYGLEKPVKPTRFRPEVKHIQTDIQKFLETNVKFLGEFMSCKTSSTHAKPVESNIEPYIHPAKRPSKETNLKTSDLIDCLVNTKKWIEEVHELTRTVASEILVYMVNDFDRMYKPEVSLAHPIAYAMKGSSMNNTIFRKMTDEVISKCEENGLQILATSSDGQWHKYGVRNEKDEPLTVLQLQKDHWKQVNSFDKNTILLKIKQTCLVRNLDDVDCKRIDPHGPLIVFKHARDRNVVGLLKGSRKTPANSPETDGDETDKRESPTIGLCTSLIATDLDTDISTMNEIEAVISSSTVGNQPTTNIEVGKKMIGLQDCFINFNEPDELPHTSLFTEELVNNAVFQNIKKNNTVDYDHYHMDDILESPSTTHTTGTLMSTAMNVLYMEEYDEMHQNATDIPYNEESEMNISLDDMDHSGIDQ